MLALLILSLPVAAEALVPSISQSYFDTYLNKCHAQLSEWKQKWGIEIGLAIFILVLGTVSAAMQNFSSRFVKVATVACGVVITITTGIVNTTRLNDHQALDKAIRKLELTIEQMESAEELYLSSTTEENRKAQLAEFDKLNKVLVDLRGSLAASTFTGGLNFSIFNTAIAMTGSTPPWVTQIPDDPGNLYFVGVADSPNFVDAVVTSKQNATQSAIDFLVSTLKNTDENHAELKQLVLSLAEDADNFSTLDKASGIFRYYSLIKINKSLVDAKINYYAVLRGTNVSQATLNAIGNSRRTRDDYSSRQLEQYEALLNKTSTILTPEQYRKFSEARALRKSNKNYDRAIALLKEVLTEKPEFYMGWYNVALAYSAAGKDDDARTSYNKAIELEPVQPSRDGTIYNAYGDLLLKQKNYCEAISNFKRSIELDDSNPRAQNNLQQALHQSSEAGNLCE